MNEKFKKESENSTLNKLSIKYSAIHISQLISGIIFISIGISSLIFYDYGMLSFLFALPHFFLTGLLPLIIGLIIVLRDIFEAETISISKTDDKIIIDVKRFIKLIKFPKIELDSNSIKYFGIKYRESKAKRWLIIFLITLITIEVDFQNAYDLWGYARIAPMLIVWTILSFIGIILFTFTPRRYIEFADDEKTIFLPYKNLSENVMNILLEIFRSDNILVKYYTISRFKKIKENIRINLFDFILGIYLLILGIMLMIPSLLFLGSFTRTICIVFGLKLLLRSLNSGDKFNNMEVSENNKVYLGGSPKLTFIKTFNPNTKQLKDISITRFHPFEILCVFYLIFQCIKYAFSFIWWEYIDFNIIYFIIGLSLIFFLFIRWFNPLIIYVNDFDNFKLKIRGISENYRNSIKENLRDFISNFKTPPNHKQFLISLLIFSGFIVFAFIYNIFGGNFLIL